MTEETAQWRGSVCILLLFFIVAFFIEGRELLIFTRTFPTAFGAGECDIHERAAEQQHAIIGRHAHYAIHGRSKSALYAE
jgi:hypothetical protein